MNPHRAKHSPKIGHPVRDPHRSHDVRGRLSTLQVSDERSDVFGGGAAGGLVSAVRDQERHRAGSNPVRLELARLRDDRAEDDDRLVVERRPVIGAEVRPAHPDRLVERAVRKEDGPVQVPRVGEDRVALPARPERVEDQVVPFADDPLVRFHRTGVVRHHREEDDFARLYVIHRDPEPGLDLRAEIDARERL